MLHFGGAEEDVVRVQSRLVEDHFKEDGDVVKPRRLVKGMALNDSEEHITGHFKKWSVYDDPNNTEVSILERASRGCPLVGGTLALSQVFAGPSARINSASFGSLTLQARKRTSVRT